MSFRSPSLNWTVPTSNASEPLNIIFHCVLSGPPRVVYCLLLSTHAVLLLPLCTFILSYGLGQSLSRRSASPAAAASAPLSHSDCFMYNMAALELLGVSRCILSCAGALLETVALLDLAGVFFTLSYYGQIFFNLLVCGEHYLAVAHPITYRGLKSQRGARIRNAAVSGVWLLCVVVVGVLSVKDLSRIAVLIILSTSLTAIAFCSISVLFTLARGAPAGAGGMSESKRKAFNTIATIVGLLSVRFFGAAMWIMSLFNTDSMCAVMTFEELFDLPSSLAPPLLFLHRKGFLAAPKCGR